MGQLSSAATGVAQDAARDGGDFAPDSTADALKARVGEASAFLKKLSNPDRLLVVCALVEGERSVRALEDALGIRQPGLSQQLAELRAAGLVAARKEGKQVFYRIADPRAERIVSTLHELFCR